MAFVSGNLGKEILQKAMKNIAYKPMLRLKKSRQTSIQDGDKLENRSSVTSPHNDPISHSLLPHDVFIGEEVKCTCNVCQEKNGIKPKPASILVENKPKVRVVQGNEKGFSYLLRILLPDRGNAVKGLKFLIADTLVFSGGEPRFLVYNSRDKYMRFIKHKDRLSLKEMMKFFQARKQRKELDGINFFNENTITMNRKIRDAKMKAYQEKMAEEAALLNQHQNQQNSPTKKEVKVVEATAHREIVICKYTDESMQVMSELDFSYLMMKRKIEAIWSQLDYIQSYIKLKKEHPYYIRVDYEHDRDKKHHLYERARDFIYYLTEEKEPELEGFDYATEEDRFEEELKSKNIFEYCQYLNFKIIIYLDAYCATRVKNMTSEYAWEDTGLVYLTNAYKIRFFNLDELDEYQLKEVEIVNDEEKQKANEKIYAGKPSPYQGKVEVLWAFRQYYEEMKKDMDINRAFEDSILENPASNEAFRLINPEASFTLYDVMTNPKQFDAFKLWLVARSQDLSSQHSKTYKSALKYTETNTSFNQNSTARSVRTTARKQEKSKVLVTDNSAKNFYKKLKVLDICGNGASKKKYIQPSEILYRSDVFSGKKMFFNETPKRLTIAANIMSPTPTEQLTKKNISMSRNNETPMSQIGVRKFRIKTNKTPTQQSTLDQSTFNKTKSLASILYLKADTSTL